MERKELAPTAGEKHLTRAILIGADTGEYDAESSMDELSELAQTAGAEELARVIQKREACEAATVIGEGKLAEVKELCGSLGAELLIFDCELTASQIRNVEDETDVRVIDRTMLILDIFAGRAVSREGKLQVELAQLKYRLPRLMGIGASLSRLGGGIGTRGPGETQLETDRRHIRRRIDKLSAELRELEERRGYTRERRRKDSVQVGAIVGYTNAGKSTLLNAITGADIPANNRLFDTLDTTTRKLAVSDQLSVLLSDTVGFIAKLPHNLVDAFRATLEELQYADLLIHVVDCADPEREAHMQVVRQLIGQLARPGVPVITAYNKTDVAEAPFLAPEGAEVAISAQTGAGIDRLLALIERELTGTRHTVTLLLPYSQGGQVDTLHQRTQVQEVSYEAEGIRIRAVLDDELYGRLRQYVTEEA